MFADVAALAIELAGAGFALDARAAFSIALHAGDWDTTRAVYLPEGRTLQAGDVLRQPELAALLRRLVAAGEGHDRRGAIAAARREFYEGDVARKLVEFNRADGGWLSRGPGRVRSRGGAGDRTPVRGVGRARGRHLLSGAGVLQALGILDGFALPIFGETRRTPAFGRRALKLAFSDRERYYGDPRFVDVPLDRLLATGHIDELRALIGERVLRKLPRRASAVPSVGYDLPLRG